MGMQLVYVGMVLLWEDCFGPYLSQTNPSVYVLSSVVILEYFFFKSWILLWLFAWEGHFIFQCSDEPPMAFNLRKLQVVYCICCSIVRAQEQNKVLTEDGHLMKALWRQPAVSVAVVTPVRTARQQSDQVSVVTADYCYFGLLSSYSGWKSRELKMRLIVVNGLSVRSYIPWKQH